MLFLVFSLKYFWVPLEMSDEMMMMILTKKSRLHALNGEVSSANFKMLLLSMLNGHNLWKLLHFAVIIIHLKIHQVHLPSRSTLNQHFQFIEHIFLPNYYSTLFCWLIAHAIHVFIIEANRKNKFHAINRWHDNHSKFPEKKIKKNRCITKKRTELLCEYIVHY